MYYVYPEANPEEFESGSCAVTKKDDDLAKANTNNDMNEDCIENNFEETEKSKQCIIISDPDLSPTKGKKRKRKSIDDTVETLRVIYQSSTGVMCLPDHIDFCGVSGDNDDKIHHTATYSEKKE